MNTEFQVNLRAFAESVKIKNAVLKLLQDCGRRRRVQILETIPASPNKIDSAIYSLISKGIVKRERIGNGVFYFISADHENIGFTPSEVASFVMTFLSFKDGCTAKEISDYLLLPKNEVQEALKILCESHAVSVETKLGKKTYSITPDRNDFSVSKLITSLMSGNTSPNFISLGCKPHACN